MRSAFPSAAKALLILAMMAAPASAVTSGPGPGVPQPWPPFTYFWVGFGDGPRLPPGCRNPDATPDLYCTASPGEKLALTLVIDIGDRGMAGYSFGAIWDEDGQTALLVDYIEQARVRTIEVSAGPPPVTVSYNITGGAGVDFPDTEADVAAKYSNSVNSPRSSGPYAGETYGIAINFEASGASPDVDLNVQTAGKSFRAGRIVVDVENSSPTTIRTGFYKANQDSMSTGKPSENLYPDRVAEVEFGVVKINAPEPAAGLALLAGIASVALLGRRGRNSR